MGHPQLWFPRLRFLTGRAGGIAIGPDHTPPWVTVRPNPRRGGAWFAGAGSTVIFSGVCQFQWRWSTPEIRICGQRFEWSSNMCLPIGLGIGGFRLSALRRMT